jgi:superfamily I DNA and RNA helicase
LEKPIENAAKTNAENQRQQNYIKKDIKGKDDIVNNPVMDKAFEALTELMMQRKRSASRSSMGSKSISSIKFSNSPMSSNSNNQKTPTPNRAIEKQKGKIGNETIGIGANRLFPRTAIYDGN